jgi:hypothetical protein
LGTTGVRDHSVLARPIKVTFLEHWNLEEELGPEDQQDSIREGKTQFRMLHSIKN